ncbi:GAF domain-containing sensor histidine kinase [Armatimonas rosea]|uniref:Oxygen sensor histidine kinase NreB n=1 Tax=Armatimonas rosea TaxID=685828 RepID=A0A7W9SWU6_ARMRO|nr:GAF domain-containing sensor histidine kinase [Armatimonas rosea]MBB6053458.1 signal transduction histidine kinase [Armatimonas rosea]
METVEALLRQQEVLRAVIESISSELNLRPLLTRIVRHACELIGADNGTIGLVDERRELVRTEAIWQMPESELGAEMPRGVGLAGKVFATGEPLVLGRYGELESTTQPSLSANAVIGIPIWWREKMIGFFGIGTDATRQSRQFDQRDVETLTLFARHAAIAIENARLYAASEHALEEMELLYATSTQIGTAHTTRELVAAYLNLVTRGGRFACTVTRYLRESTEVGTVEVLGRWTPQDGLDLTPHHYPYHRDALDEALDRGETLAIPDVHTDQRVPETLRRIQAESGRPALALIPLRVAGAERLGHVILSHSQIHDWTPVELHPFEITAQQLASALDSRLQQERVATQGQQMAIFEERQRIARDLHDSVTQLLFTMTLIAQTTAAAWKRNPDEGERRVGRLVELSQTALSEMRALLAELRPPVPQPTGRELLETKGLVAALEAHLAATSDESTPVVLKVQRYRPATFVVEHALYRIIQEAVANARKHAQARQVSVTLSTLSRGTTRLVIQDDGCGFDTRTPTAPRADGSGMGLSTMQERVVKLGGTLTIDSRLGAGTRITVRVA